jgi:hypothetical protein
VIDQGIDGTEGLPYRLETLAYRVRIGDIGPDGQYLPLLALQIGFQFVEELGRAGERADRTALGSELSNQRCPETGANARDDDGSCHSSATRRRD